MKAFLSQLPYHGVKGHGDCVRFQELTIALEKLLVNLPSDYGPIYVAHGPEMH